MSGTSEVPKVRYIANLAAWSLILASSGFGCVYAYTISIGHGRIMAFFTILFVIALEVLKPLSIAYAFACFNNLHLIRGLLLALLGVTAIAYSLTAELSLMYAARSDVAAVRKSESISASASTQQYETAASELKTLPKSRSSVAEIESDIISLKAKYRNHDLECKYIETKTESVVCAQIAKLQGEIGVVRRREQLQSIIDKFVYKSPEQNVEKIADPSSAAIKTYLKLFGVSLDESIIAQYVVLVPIIALELGSALGLLLVRAISETAKNDLSHTVSNTDTVTNIARKVLLRQLEGKDEVVFSQRNLAKREGIDKSAINRAIKDLKREGVIDMATHPLGSRMKLRK